MTLGTYAHFQQAQDRHAAEFMDELLAWILELVPFSKSARSDLAAGRQKGWYSEGLACCLSDGGAAFAEHCG
jgi:hypothetical protein